MKDIKTASFEKVTKNKQKHIKQLINSNQHRSASEVDCEEMDFFYRNFFLGLPKNRHVPAKIQKNIFFVL